jgi:micrococcal nuclease
MTPLAGILSAFLISTSTGPTTTQTPVAQTAVVERIVDGDTFIGILNRKRERIRIIGIDAPESVAPRRPVDCYGPESAKRLKTLLPTDSLVTLTAEPKTSRDRYGRLLRYVLADNQDVGALMIEGGYARHYNKFTHPRQSEYAYLETTAREYSVGLWSECK